MIELAIGPGHRIVTTCARRGEVRPQVIDWSFRVVVVRLMARNAIRVRNVVVVVDVAIRALARWNRVRIIQGEAGFRVIETRRLPG